MAKCLLDTISLQEVEQSQLEFGIIIGGSYSSKGAEFYQYLMILILDNKYENADYFNRQELEGI